MVNAKGGANGYKVVVKTEDDGGDPAKASEAMKKLLAAGVVAIVGENVTTTESVWAPLATAAGVPIIGGGAYSPNWTGNPLYFPVTTTAIVDGLQAGVQDAAKNGIKKIGATYDAAIPAAAQGRAAVRELREEVRHGVDRGPRGRRQRRRLHRTVREVQAGRSRGDLHRFRGHRTAADGA